MTTGKEIDNPVFDHRTLRMLIGALAFGLPPLVYVFAGRVTFSISSSYHEEPTRNMFVGSVFVIATLLISYKGHLQGEVPEEGTNWWSYFWSFKWISTYQEDVISTIGGVAGITMALFPTACDTCDWDRTAIIHTISAFILFANVVYFCMVGFLRSVNGKLLDYQVFKEDAEFLKAVEAIRAKKTLRTWNPLVFVWNLLTIESSIFRALLARKLRQYADDKGMVRFGKVWTVYGKKFARGLVYVVFGSLTVLVLAAYIVLELLIALKFIPDIITHTVVTFWIEAFSLWFFGVAWMTASQLEYGRQISEAWERLWHKQPASPQPGTP